MESQMRIGMGISQRYQAAVDEQAAALFHWLLPRRKGAFMAFGVGIPGHQAVKHWLLGRPNAFFRAYFTLPLGAFFITAV